MTTAPERPAMQVAFLHSVGWDLRYLIARVTGRPVHVATIYDRNALYEAAFSGMRTLPTSIRLLSGEWELVDVPAGYDVAAARAIAERDLGAKYDWVGAIAAWWLGRMAGPGSRDRLFCSETAAEQLRAAGVPLLYRRAAHYMPRALRDELVNIRHWASHRVLVV